MRLESRVRQSRYWVRERATYSAIVESRVMGRGVQGLTKVAVAAAVANRHYRTVERDRAAAAVPAGTVVAVGVDIVSAAGWDDQR